MHACIEYRAFFDTHITNVHTQAKYVDIKCTYISRTRWQCPQQKQEMAYKLRPPRVLPLNDVLRCNHVSPLRWYRPGIARTWICTHECNIEIHTWYIHTHKVYISSIQRQVRWYRPAYCPSTQRALTLDAKPLNPQSAPKIYKKNKK